MAELTGVIQLENPTDKGIKLSPSGTMFVAVGYDQKPSGGTPLQPMVGGRLLYIDGNKIKALPEATP